ncbi:MAG: helix-turn-helix domain-containing protein [Bacteroidota bacterium]
MEYSSQHINDPILPSQEEVILARETRRKLAQSIDPEQIISLKIKGKEGELDLPASAVRLLLDVLKQKANGNAVTLTPLHAELSTNQVAALLRVSRPFLIKLLEEGEIPFR